MLVRESVSDFFSPFNVKLTKTDERVNSNIRNLFRAEKHQSCQLKPGQRLATSLSQRIAPTPSSPAGIYPSSSRKVGLALSTNIPPSSTGYRHTLHAQDLLFRRSEHRTTLETFWPRVQRHDRNTPETPDKRK